MNNIEDIISKLKNNSREENILFVQQLKNGLSESQNEAVNSLLGNKELLQKLFEKKEVKALINELSGDKNGHK